MYRVLIVPHTRGLDALVFRLVEALDYDPVLLAKGESPASAVERLTPAAVMMDADHPATGEPALMRAAQLANAPVILFSASRTLGELRREAETHSGGYFLLPNGPRALAASIGEALVAARRDVTDEDTARIVRWARLTAHHQERVRWHETVMARVEVDVELAVERRQAVVLSREALHRARDAAREANAQLHVEVTRYVQHLKMLDLTKAELVSRVGGVVHGALDDAQSGVEADALEAQVEAWCMEAYEAA